LVTIHHHVRPEGTHAPNGYSHAVTASGPTVHVSGQVALDADGQLIGAGDAEAQMEQVFRNIAAALADAGASLTDVVKLTVFLTDMGDLRTFATVRDRHIDVARPPASSAVQVVALARPELLVEVEAVAVVRS
jgi:reactive intermediate/imine deaminase